MVPVQGYWDSILALNLVMLESATICTYNNSGGDQSAFGSEMVKEKFTDSMHARPTYEHSEI